MNLFVSLPAVERIDVAILSSSARTNNIPEDTPAFHEARQDSPALVRLYWPAKRVPARKAVPIAQRQS